MKLQVFRIAGAAGHSSLTARGTDGPRYVGEVFVELLCPVDAGRSPYCHSAVRALRVCTLLGRTWSCRRSCPLGGAGRSRRLPLSILAVTLKCHAMCTRARRPFRVSWTLGERTELCGTFQAGSAPRKEGERLPSGIRVVTVTPSRRPPATTCLTGGDRWQSTAYTQ